jgi:hypothetical protein
VRKPGLEHQLKFFRFDDAVRATGEMEDLLVFDFPPEILHSNQLFKISRDLIDESDRVFF